MVRVLQVYPQMNNAGTEKVIINLYENIDTTKVQFDFLVEKKGELDEIIRKMGGKIFYLYSENKKQYYKDLLLFLKKHPEYKIVHTHTHARMGVVLKAARKCGIPCRVAHSHNARNDLPQLAALIKGLISIPMELDANYFFACSENAARWLFPHKIKQCKILYNGIQLKKYLFNKETRQTVRGKLQLDENEFVMIHVGRFARQKNHTYLVEILDAYNKKIGEKWKILLVGEGPLQDEVKRQIDEKGLSEHVIFMNNRTDVNELLSAADMFVFPSLHEGLGIVVVEAQTNGLPCIVSDAVPQEADMNIGLVHTLSLRQTPEKWADFINGKRVDVSTRTNYKERIMTGKYNIETIGFEMQQFYIQHGGQ